MPFSYLDPNADGAQTAWTKSTGSAAWSLLDDATRAPTAATTASDYIQSGTSAQQQDIAFPNTLTYDSTAKYVLRVYGRAGQRRGWTTAISVNEGSSFGTATAMATPATSQGAAQWFSRDVTSLITNQTALNGFRVRFATTTTTGTPTGNNQIYAAYLEVYNAPTSPTLLGIQDDFNDNSLNLSVWGENDPNGTTVAETNGTIVISPPAPASGYGGIQLIDVDLTNKAIVINLKQALNAGSGSTETMFYIRNNYDETNVVGHYVAGNPRALYPIVKQAGTGADGPGTTYNATTMAWLRLGFDGQRAVWEIAPDNGSGYPGMWSVFYILDMPTMVTNHVDIIINAGHWGTEASPGTAIFDNFNVVAPSDSTPPTVAVTSASSFDMSANAGYNSYSYSFTVDEACQAWDLRLVPGESSPRTAGTSIESGGAVASGGTVSGDVTYAELIGAGGSPGDNVVKAFAQDLAGNWSAL